jgi:hypothetical protein
MAKDLAFAQETTTYPYSLNVYIVVNLKVIEEMVSLAE